MKIVHFIWAFPIGGAETMLVEIMNVQCDGNTVALVVINNLVNEELLMQVDKRVRIIKINRPVGSKNVWYYFKTWFALKIEQADIIHCHNDNLSIFNKYVSGNFVLTIHSVDFNRKHLDGYKKIFAISKIVKENIEKRTDIIPILVYNGVNTALVNSIFSGVNDNFRIIQISRLEHCHKGQDILINAISYLNSNNSIEGLTVDFVGAGSSKEYLQELISKLKIDKYFNFLGERNRDFIYKNLCSYDLLIQPSIFEGFGLTVVEAMIAKVPVLVSNIDGPKEIIQNGKFGLSFKKGDVIDCAAKILEIIQNYQYYTQALRLAEIRQYAISNFDIQKTAKKYVTEYRGI